MLVITSRVTRPAVIAAWVRDLPLASDLACIGARPIGLCAEAISNANRISLISNVLLYPTESNT